MRFDIVSIFPEFFRGPFDYGIVRRALEAGLITVAVQDLRQFTTDRHRTVDDRPFGGGEGMVLKPEPLFAAVECLRAEGPQGRVILLSAQGRLFTQAEAARLAGLERLILLCGRYEGVDERVATGLADEELSVGEYVLSGGELAAAVVLDCVTRLLPGALGNQASAVQESFAAGPAAGDAAGVLDCPHYTRPAVFGGLAVPEVLLSGHHEQVRRWRRKMALEKTLRNRPDLLERARLTEEDRQLLATIMEERREK